MQRVPVAARPIARAAARPARAAPSRRRPAPLELAVLAVVAAAMAVTLPLPFNADQALFATGAREIAHGALYYRDFWDIKQPGIYLFFAAARALGGGPMALHVLELLWTLALAVVLQRCSRDWFSRAWLSAALPLAVVLPYALSARAYTLQVEWLAQAPLVACLALALRGAATGRGRDWAAAGLAAGIVLVGKLLLAPIVLVLVVAALVRAHRAGAPRRTLAAALGAVAAGAAAVLASAAAPFLIAGAGGLLWRTTVVYPPLVARTPEQHTGELAGLLARRGLRVYSATGVLAATGLLLGARARRTGGAAAVGGPAGPRTGGAPVGALVGWVLAAVAVVSQQRWSDYQVYLVLAPVGILAAVGVDRLLSVLARAPAGRRRVLRTAVAVAIAVLALPGLAGLVAPLRASVSHRLALTADDREAWRRAVSPEYAAAQAELEAVRPLLPAGASLYVLGSPLYYTGLGADQALEINGFSPQQLVPRQWQELTREFQRTHPRVVRVDARAEAPLRAGSPVVADALRTDYRVLRTSPEDPLTRGTWYVLAGPTGPAAPHADGTRL